VFSPACIYVHKKCYGGNALRTPAYGFLYLLVALLLMADAAQAQSQFDVGFGVSGIKGTSANNATVPFFPQDVGGGAFPTFSGDLLLYKHLGVGGEASWRATQNLSGGGQPFRPIFYDMGLVYAPPLNKFASAELTTGLGGESIRFYQANFTCSSFSCSNFVSSNHLLWEVGGGLRLYPWRSLFVRPEVHYYLIHNNLEFSSNHATRLGVSVGYSFGRE